MAIMKCLLNEHFLRVLFYCSTVVAVILPVMALFRKDTIDIPVMLGVYISTPSFFLIMLFALQLINNRISPIFSNTILTINKAGMLFCLPWIYFAITVMVLQNYGINMAVLVMGVFLFAASLMLYITTCSFCKKHFVKTKE